MMDLRKRLRNAERAATAMAVALDDLNWSHPAWLGDDPDRTAAQADAALSGWIHYELEYNTRRQWVRRSIQERRSPRARL